MTKVRARWLLLFFALVTLLPQCNGIDDLVGDFILANGSNPSGWFNRGWTLVDQGNYNEATKSREIAIQPDPKLSSLSWYYQGLNNLLKSEYNKSIFYFERAIEIYPNLEFAWNDRGVALVMLERYEEALKSFERAIEINSKYAVPWYNKGYLFYILGDYYESIKYLDESLRIDHKYINAWILKGLILEKLGRYNESLQSLDLGLLFNPKNELALNEKGFVLYKIGRYNESIRTSDRALEVNPDNAYSWNNKGIALDELGRYEDAIECYDKAIEIYLNYSLAWNNKGWSLYKIGRLNESMECYDKAILLDSNFVQPWKNKALALYALGRDAEAEYALARAEILTKFSYAEPELVEAAFIRGHFSKGNGIWQADDFGWFYYNLDEDLGGEVLRIDMQGRIAEKEHIIYSSKTWSQQFKYEPWGCFYEVAFKGNAYLAGYPKSSFTEELSSLERGELRSVLMDDDMPQTLNRTRTLILQQGYVLVPQKISKKNSTVDFLLLKNGMPVYASMVSIGESFIYKINDTPIILIHLADVMQRGIDELAEVDGIFQVSDVPDIKFFEGALDGNMKLTTLSKESLVFQNNDSLLLNRDSNVFLFSNLKLIVLDQPDLNYYPVGAIFDYGVHEIRGPVFDARPYIPVRVGDYNSSVVARWNSLNYSGFFFDQKQSLGAETLAFFDIKGRTIEPARTPIVYQENKTVVQSGFQYTTVLQAKEFEYKPWGHYFVISFLGATWFAGYDSSLQGKIASKSLLEEECLGRILLDTKLQEANISEGNYTLEEGYEIRISDLSNDSLFLQLLKGESIVDNWVVESNATYVYRKDLENVKDMPIVMMHFGNVSHNGTHSFAALDGIFQISERYVLPINQGTGFGELVIVSVQPDHIILVNNDPINLNRDSVVNIGPLMDIHVADNDTLRYYLNTSVYVVPSPEPPMIKTLDNVSSSASANFSMTIRAAEIRQVQVQILDSTNRTVFIRDITNLGQGSGDLWGFNWKWNATTMMLSDDRSLVLDASGNAVPGLLYLNSSTSPRLVGVKFNSEGRISAIMDSVSAYYVSSGEYKQLNSSFDYDAMLANNTIREQYLKIEPGKSILQFLNVINGKFAPSKVNHTLQGNFEALQPHIIAVGAKPGRYELQVRVENAVNVLSTFGDFFNVTNTVGFVTEEKGEAVQNDEP